MPCPIRVENNRQQLTQKTRSPFNLRSVNLNQALIHGEKENYRRKQNIRN